MCAHANQLLCVDLGISGFCKCFIFSLAFCLLCNYFRVASCLIEHIDNGFAPITYATEYDDVIWANINFLYEQMD